MPLIELEDLLPVLGRHDCRSSFFPADIEQFGKLFKTPQNRKLIQDQVQPGTIPFRHGRAEQLAADDIHKQAADCGREHRILRIVLKNDRPRQAELLGKPVADAEATLFAGCVRLRQRTDRRQGRDPQRQHQAQRGSVGHAIVIEFDVFHRLITFPYQFALKLRIGRIKGRMLALVARSRSAISRRRRANTQS